RVARARWYRTKGFPQIDVCSFFLFSCDGAMDRRNCRLRSPGRGAQLDFEQSGRANAHRRVKKPNEAYEWNSGETLAVPAPNATESAVRLGRRGALRPSERCGDRRSSVRLAVQRATTRTASGSRRTSGVGSSVV